MTEIHTYYQDHELELKATYYKAKNTANNSLIIYFHGGGLIYGDRDDLPIKLKERLLAEGYSLLCLDYPFVPEVKIDIIVERLLDGIAWGLDTFRPNEYLLFGRSAGAYLALLLADRLKETPPLQVIAFYGYASLTEPGLVGNSTYYQAYPAIPYMSLQQLISPIPLANATIHQRFPLYLAYRQTGTWVDEILGWNLTAPDFSLTDSQLAELPPTFLTASRADQDVPFEISAQLTKVIPNTLFFPVDNLTHNFDEDSSLPVVLELYDTLLKWLKKE